MKNQRGFSILFAVLIVVIVALLVGVGYLVYKKYGSSASQTQTRQSISGQTADYSAKVVGDFSVVVKENPTDPTKSDIYLKDNKTNQETLFLTLPDLYRSHYHNAEYHNGNVYLIRRTGGENGYQANPNWTDELWEYNQEKQGRKLYSNRGLDFRVSDDGNFIAIVGSGVLNFSGENLVMLDGNGVVLKTVLSADQVNASISPLFWHNHDFWVNQGFGGGLNNLIKINVENFSITNFDVSALAIQREFDINPTREKIVFSDYPAMSDVDSVNQFKASKRTINLFVYDLNSKAKQLIVTSVAKQFNPKWVDANTIEYDNPNGIGRILKVVN